MSNWVWKSAVELAQIIRDRQISAIKLLNAHLEQIAQHNSKLNAICTLDEKNACIRAKQADEALASSENWGALHGVPVTIKDIFETSRLRTTAGYIAIQSEWASCDRHSHWTNQQWITDWNADCGQAVERNGAVGDRSTNNLFWMLSRLKHRR